MLLGLGVPKNEAGAYAVYQECAASGSTAAMNALGIMCSEGVGTVKNFNSAKTWLTTAANLGYSKAEYNLALLYKDATGSNQDYVQAYYYFSKAAEHGNSDGKYGKAYLLYKGFGCMQNYNLSKAYFSQCANAGMRNGMYFLGLCYRNGYGTALNIDSAHYWLVKSAALGYEMAQAELSTPQPENTGSSTAGRNTMQGAEENDNKFLRVEQHIQSNDINGEYQGTIRRYDWSGNRELFSHQLSLKLKQVGNSITGVWQENSATVNVEGTIESDRIIFKKGGYYQYDHYNDLHPLYCNFEDAKLQVTQKDGITYIIGNIAMFSPEINEPQKPLMVKLTAPVVKVSAEETQPFTVSPNPFGDAFNVAFSLDKKCSVSIQVLSTDGTVLYIKKSGVLAKGAYSITARPGQHLASGSYILLFKAGNAAATRTLIKL